MTIEQLQKEIHDVAMAVRDGDMAMYSYLQELRQLHREMQNGETPKEPEVTEEPKEPKVEKPKKASNKR